MLVSGQRRAEDWAHEGIALGRWARLRIALLMPPHAPRCARGAWAKIPVAHEGIWADRPFAERGPCGHSVAVWVLLWGRSYDWYIPL